MDQTNQIDQPVTNFSDLVTVLKLGNQNMSQLITQVLTRFGAQSAVSATYGTINSTAGGNQIKIGNGYLITLSVTTASSGTSIIGTVYDSNTVVGLGSSCAIGIIPSSGMITYNWPYSKGLVIQPGSSVHTVAVSYV